jgi:uncharacterized protein
VKIIPEPLEFEWDDGNINKNLIKHNVTIKEAEEVFLNCPLLVFEDRKHSTLELRLQALGQTNKNRKLFLSFTKRNNKIRMISVRAMSRKERSIYEKEEV